MWSMINGALPAMPEMWPGRSSSSWIRRAMACTTAPRREDAAGMITPERSSAWPGCRSGSCLWPALTIPARRGGLPTASLTISCSGRRAWMSCRSGRIPWPGTSVRSWSLSKNDAAGSISGQPPREDGLRHAPVWNGIVGEPECGPSGGVRDEPIPGAKVSARRRKPGSDVGAISDERIWRSSRISSRKVSGDGWR